MTSTGGLAFEAVLRLDLEMNKSRIAELRATRQSERKASAQNHAASVILSGPASRGEAASAARNRLSPYAVAIVSDDIAIGRPRKSGLTRERGIPAARGSAVQVMRAVGLCGACTAPFRARKHRRMRRREHR
jgi:hypothetical protein